MSDEDSSDDGRVRRFLRQVVTSKSGAVFILLVGISIGWWVGSFTACAGSGCEVRVDSIEALGTWVGGLGTITAVYWAAATYRREETLRRAAVEREDRLRREDLERDERLRSEDAERYEKQLRDAAEQERTTKAQQMERFTAEANAVQFRAQVGGGTAHIVDTLRFNLVNKAATTSIYRAQFKLDGWPELREIHELTAGNTHVWEYRTNNVNPHLPQHVAKVRRAAFEAEMLAKATLTWTMNGIEWTKTGDGPAEVAAD